MFRRDLQNLLKREEDDIVNWLVDRLHKRAGSPYGEIAPQALEQRARTLVERLASSAGRKAAASGEGIPFVWYVAQIAEERISEGYALEELQVALSKLEERIWQLVLAYRDPCEQVRELGEATYIIGMAKDHLARIYLQHKDHGSTTWAPEELEMLARGTVSGPLPEE